MVNEEEVHQLEIGLVLHGCGGETNRINPDGKGDQMPNRFPDFNDGSRGIGCRKYLCCVKRRK